MGNHYRHAWKVCDRHRSNIDRCRGCIIKREIALQRYGSGQFQVVNREGGNGWMQVIYE